ncbi:hypothetical protein BT93_I0865 [Corymbia citriodora subsp. variegata]|nr:hypothetical protein BT93_I0865 [Corymbia citriodora subsp. variegata]
MASASLSTPQLPTLQFVSRARGSAPKLGSLSAIIRADFTLSGKITFTPKVVIIKAGRGFALVPSLSRNQISCSVAQPETLKTVQGIIAKQLSIDETTVTSGTKFVDLGADSLDTVEIMMTLEETFGVLIGEGGAEDIATVQDAADLIEKVKAGSA